MDGVVPVATEIGASDANSGHLFLRDNSFRRVAVGIEDATDFQSGCCACIGDQIDDGRVRQEGLAAPVLGDEGK